MSLGFICSARIPKGPCPGRLWETLEKVPEMPFKQRLSQLVSVLSLALSIIPPSLPAPSPDDTPSPAPAHFTIDGAFIAGSSSTIYGTGVQSAGTTYRIAATGRFPKKDGSERLYVSGEYDNQKFLNQFSGASSSDAFTEARAGVAIPGLGAYVGAGYINENLGGPFPLSANGVGLGFEKLTEIRAPFTYYFSAFYYPNLAATSSGQTLGATAYPASSVSFKLLRYGIGTVLNFGRSPLYFNLGTTYNQETVKGFPNGHGDNTRSIQYAGLGVRF